jgi:hypothetical protein
MSSDEHNQPPLTLPGGYPREADALGPALFRTPAPGIPEGAFKPVFAAVLSAIPGVICIAVGPLLPRLIGIAWAMLVTAFGVWFVRWQLRKAGAYAVAHRGGFVQHDGGDFIVWRWADVSIVNMQAVDFRTHSLLFGELSRLLAKHYRLRAADGREYGLWTVRGSAAERFGMLAERETFALMMPAAEAAIRDGRGAEFRPFRMTSDGLEYRGRLAPWAEVGATLSEGKLHVTGVSSGRVSTLLEHIDNSHVFLVLLDREVGIRPEG